MTAGQGRPTSYAEIAEFLGRLGIVLYEARRARGLSVRAAAADIGLSPSTVTRIETGQDCSLENALAVIHWLDVVGRPS